MAQMELKVFKSTVAAYGGRWETRLELPVETELLIPDYLPAVFKIVKCLVRPVLMQNRVAGTRWTGEGYLRCTVYYQSDEEGTQLCRAEQKFPFEKTADLPDGQYQEGPALFWGEAEYVNCRAVSERRIDVRGAYALCLAVTAAAPLEVIGSLADCGIEQRTQKLCGSQCAGVEEKLITTEEEIDLPGAGEMILDIDGNVQGSASALAGQANWQGTLTVQACYRLPGNGQISARSKEIPVRQTLDMDAAAEGDECLCWGEVLAATLTAAEDGRQPTLSVQWKLHVELWRKAEYMVVKDAYSTECDTRVQPVTLQLLERQNLELPPVRAQIEDELPQQDAEVKGCFVELGQLAPIAGETPDTVVLAGRGVAHVICADERGELTCFDRSFTWQLPGRWPGAPAGYCARLYTVLRTLSAGKEGDRLRVTMELLPQGMLFAARQYQAAGEVELGEEIPDRADGPALYLYYPQPGECIFDIAKRYHARPKDVAAANHLEAAPGETLQELCTQADHLLIPAAL